MPAPFLLALLACTSGVNPELSKEEYAEALARATCDFYERCGLLGDYHYSSAETCVESNLPTLEDQLDDDTLCGAYRGDAALECVEGIDALACEDQYSAWPGACSDACSYSG